MRKKKEFFSCLILIRQRHDLCQNGFAGWQQEELVFAAFFERIALRELLEDSGLLQSSSRHEYRKGSGNPLFYQVILLHEHYRKYVEKQRRSCPISYAGSY
jgi:hypothetical protein